MSVTAPAFSADHQDVVSKFYQQIMKFETDYRAENQTKAFVGCIDWDRSTPSRVVVWHALWYYSAGDAPMFVSKLARYALNDCDRDRAKDGSTCECVIIDKNDTPVLKIPQKYLELYESQKPSLSTDDAICRSALASRQGVPRWDDRNASRDFVAEAKRRGLTPEKCFALLELTTLKSETGLPASARRSFQEYLSGSKFTDFKAFAVDPRSGDFGRSWGHTEPTTAIYRALAECRTRSQNCILWAVGNTVVARMTPEQVEAVTALDSWENALGPAHPGMGWVLNKLAESLRKNENYAQAEPLYMLALTNAEKAIELGRRDELSLANLMATTLENYAALLRETERSAEAKELEARAKAIQAKHAGE